MKNILIILTIISLNLSTSCFANNNIYERNIITDNLRSALQENCGNNMFCKKNMVRFALDAYWGQMVMQNHMGCGERAASIESNRIIAKKYNIPYEKVISWSRDQFMLKEKAIITLDERAEIYRQATEKVKQQIVLSALKRIELFDFAIFPICGQESFQ